MAFAKGVRAFFIFTGLCLASAVNGAEAIGLKSDAPPIRVRTSHNQKLVLVSGFGLRINGEEILKTNLPKKFSFRVSAEATGWSIDLGRDGHKVQPVHLTSDEVEVVGDNLTVNGQPTADRFILIKNSHAVAKGQRGPASGLRFDVVSVLALDDYLKGVVPSEMPSRWPLESLKAQVVASRSYALTEMKVHQGESFHLDDSILHQVFNWSKFLGASQVEQERINKAINETSDEILADRSGGPYRAYFHSDCGGHTEEPSAVWGGAHKNGTVADQHCALNAKGQWAEEIRREEFSRLVAQYFNLRESVEVTSLSVGALSASGRVQNLVLALNDSGQTQKRVLTSQALRQIFGFTRIKSANFHFDLDSTRVKFSGRGSGHGVGLCQQGAKYMALTGSDYRAILKRYYPAAQLAHRL